MVPVCDRRHNVETIRCEVMHFSAMAGAELCTYCQRVPQLRKDPALLYLKFQSTCPTDSIRVIRNSKHIATVIVAITPPVIQERRPLTPEEVAGILAFTT